MHPPRMVLFGEGYFLKDSVPLFFFKYCSFSGVGKEESKEGRREERRKEGINLTLHNRKPTLTILKPTVNNA